MRVGRNAARRARSLGLAFALVTGLAAMAGACREPTQVTLDITYRGPCRDVRGIALIVATDSYVAEERIDTNVFTTSVGNETCTEGVNGAPSRIGTLVVTPNDNSGRASIVVLASFGSKAVDTCKRVDGYFGCIVARRAFTFVESSKLELAIGLDPQCKDVPCDAISTCRKGACVDSFVDCSSGTCPAEPGDPGDGGIVTVDAPTSSDAYVQGDAPKDSPTNDAPTDANGADASDGAVCSVRRNIRCDYPDLAGPVVCDAPTEGCCWAPDIGVVDAGMAGAQKSPGLNGPGYRCSPIDGPVCTAPSFGNPPITCLGAANCAGGQLCCAFGTSMPIGCAGTCNGDGGSGIGQVCLEDCECPSKRCGAATSVGTDPPQTIRYCESP